MYTMIIFSLDPIIHQHNNAVKKALKIAKVMKKDIGTIRFVNEFTGDTSTPASVTSHLLKAINSKLVDMYNNGLIVNRIIIMQDVNGAIVLASNHIDSDIKTISGNSDRSFSRGEKILSSNWCDEPDITEPGWGVDDDPYKFYY